MKFAMAGVPLEVRDIIADRDKTTAGVRIATDRYGAGRLESCMPALGLLGVFPDQGPNGCNRGNAGLRFAPVPAPISLAANGNRAQPPFLRAFRPQLTTQRSRLSRKSQFDEKIALLTTAQLTMLQLSIKKGTALAPINWDEKPLECTAILDGVPVCAIKTKDIGGCIANWLDDRKWAPPAHLTKSTPQDAKFLTDKESAKLAVEKALRDSL